MQKFLLTFLTFYCAFAFAQTRPKVGLALSGGGAKSMAQLGALRAIEESGIKIDYISGTSMGAVIGAMYAMGYTVDEIEEYLAKVNWEELLTDDVPRNRLPFLNKNDKKYLVRFNIKDGKFTLPRAFNEGHYMVNMLSFLTMKAHNVTDFSQLPIPFLCMATDLETGESVAFEKGSLTNALRASVAFPSLFSPYEIDGRLYVDGGVRNNLPIAILKNEKKMDYVIAIDVQSKLYKKEDLNSIIQVLEQVGSFMNADYFEEQKPLADILVYPNMSPFKLDDYQYSDSIIKLGYLETKLYAKQLQETAQKQGNIAPIRNCCIATPPEKIQVDSVFINEPTGKKEKAAKQILRLTKTGEYDYKKFLNTGLDRLYGTDAYEKVNFSYKKINNKNTLTVNLIEKPSHQSFKFGIHYDDDFGIAVLTNYTLLNAGLSNATFKAEVALSENPRGSISWIVQKGVIPALGVIAYFNQFDATFYLNQKPRNRFTYLTYNIDAFLHSTFSNNYTIGTGLKWDNVDLSQDIPSIDFEKQNNSYFIYHAFLDFDSFNEIFKPTKGFKLKAKMYVVSDYETDVSNSTSSIFGLTFTKAIALGNRFGFDFGIDGAATIGGNLHYPYNVFVGGLGQNYINFTFPFLGYRHMELIGNNFASAKANIFYNFYKNHYVTASANIGKLETTVADLINSDILLDGYGLSYAYNSALGPMQLTVMGSTNHSEVYTYLSLGFWF